MSSSHILHAQITHNVKLPSNNAINLAFAFAKERRLNVFEVFVTVTIRVVVVAGSLGGYPPSSLSPLSGGQRVRVRV